MKFLLLKYAVVIACLTAAALTMLPAQQPASSAAGAITMERICLKPYIAGTRPGDQLSPDGHLLLYQWDDKSENKSKQWMMNSDGTNNRRMVDTLVGEIEFSPDKRTVAVTRGGDIFFTDTSFSAFTRVTKTSVDESGLTFSPDGKLLAFGYDSKIMAIPASGSGLIELVAPSAKDASVSLAGFSKDCKRILFTESSREGLKEFIVPRYTGKDVATRSFKAGLSLNKIGFAPVDTGAIVWIKLPGEARFFTGDADIAPDGKSAFVERYSADRKSREIFIADADSGKTVRIFEEKDPAWVEAGGYEVRWMPDGKHIAYTSEREGWNQCYLVTPDGKHTRRVTKGDWEIRWFAIDPSGKTIYMEANKDDHGQWQLYSCDVESGTMTRLTTHDGSYENPVLSKDGAFIIALWSDVGRPGDLVRVSTSAPAVASSRPVAAGESQLTHSIPDEYKSIHWTIPEIVHFTSRDDKSVPAFIYKPANFDPAKKYPAVVFVHGAGYLQNVFRGWSYYQHEFMFATRLNNLGYIVYEVEYRGSAGLGREFRTDVYMHLGGKDLDDEVDGLKYLKSLGYVDPDRVGMYGGSYGGFMTLMGLFLTDQYACGAALRAVTSWENYYDHNSWYTEARLGKPADHPDAYKISDPITYAESLKKPLLILHGMVDDNVFFQDAVQLVNKLQKAKKKFELMVYPEEAHSFTKPESWFDEYSRIEDFFNRNLKP